MTSCLSMPTTTSARTPRRWLPALLLATAVALALAASMAMPTVALADSPVTSEDAPDRTWNGPDANADEESPDDIGDKPMYKTVVKAGNLFESVAGIGTSMGKALYDILANGADLCAMTAGLVMSNIGVDGLFGSFSTGDWVGVYRACVAVADRAVIPIATGFLGLLMVAELIAFAKDGASGRGRDDLWGSYLFIVVKYMIIQTLITNITLVMAGIYSLVAEIGNFMVGTLGMAGTLAGGNWGVLQAVDAALTSITYDQGAGAALLVLLVALVSMCTCVLTYIYVQVVFVMRMFELYVRTAFAAFPAVMCASRQTRDGGIRYFKKYAGCCLQALIVVLVISLGGLVMQICGNIRTITTGNVVADLVIAAVPPLVGALAMFMMVKQSREFADQLVGA